MGKTIGTRILERSIIKHIEKSPITGVGVGKDFSILSDGCTVVAEGFADTPYDLSRFLEDGDTGRGGTGIAGLSIGELALIRALNNLVCSGVRYSPNSAETNEIDMSITIQAGTGCPEQKLRDEMVLLTVAAEKRGIRIIGGNTVYSSDGDSYSVSVTVYGKVADEDKVRYTEKTHSGDHVFVFGNVGHFGASLAVTENPEKPQEKLPFSYIKSALVTPESLEIGHIAREMIDMGAFYLHDITFGGVYRSFLETALHFDMGITVIHENVPIRQDTIEICEVFGLNPYEITGTGGLIGVFHMKEAEENYEKICKLGSVCKLSALLTVNKSKIVVSNNNTMSRSLTYYK